METKQIEHIKRQMNNVLSKICELSIRQVSLLSQKDSFIYNVIINRQASAIKGLLDFHDKLKFKLKNIENELHTTVSGVIKNTE